METDADRLSSIKALGGQVVRHGGGEFWAIFDREFVATDVGLQIEGRNPALTCRSSDVDSLPKDEALTVGTVDYRIKRPEPAVPAPGWTILLLRA